MTNKAPDRIWYDGAFQHAKCILHRPPEGDSNPRIEYLRKDAACVEVRPLDWDGPKCGIWDAGKRFVGDCASYKIIWDLGREETYTAYFGNKRICVRSNLEAAKAAAQEDYENRIRSALTIRTVEDVRREALMEAVRLLELPSGLMTPPAAQRIRNLIDNPAPSRENCPECKGSGMRDSGGVHPWGEHIDVPCDCGEPQPTPSREEVTFKERDWTDRECVIVSGDEQPTPSPEPDDDFCPASINDDTIYIGTRAYVAVNSASHAEELRKAKEDAWDEGYQWAYDGMSQRNPYRRTTDEGGGK